MYGKGKNDLFIKPSKMIVYAAIGAMFAFMGAMVFVSTMDFEELEKAEIKLAGVEVTDVNSIENHITLKTTLLITNHGERTFVIPIITHEQFVNGKLIINIIAFYKITSLIMV